MRRNDGPTPTFSRAIIEAANRTIHHWIESGKLPATKHGSQCKIAPADLEPLLDSRPPDVRELLTRLQALEDLEDVQASQASRLTDLERQAFHFLVQRNAELEARIADLERTHRKRKPKPPLE